MSATGIAPSLLNWEIGSWQIPGEGRSLYLFTNYSDRTVTLGIEPVDIRKGIPSEYTFRPGEVLSVEVPR